MQNAECKVQNETRDDCMDKIWRLLTAMFIMMVGAVSLIMAYILFVDTALAVVGVYAAFICIPWGIAKGLLVIIDYHREQKEKEE